MRREGWNARSGARLNVSRDTKNFTPTRGRGLLRRKESCGRAVPVWETPDTYDPHTADSGTICRNSSRMWSNSDSKPAVSTRPIPNA